VIKSLIVATESVLFMKEYRMREHIKPKFILTALVLDYLSSQPFL